MKRKGFGCCHVMEYTMSYVTNSQIVGLFLKTAFPLSFCCFHSELCNSEDLQKYASVAASRLQQKVESIFSTINEIEGIASPCLWASFSREILPEWFHIWIQSSSRARTNMRLSFSNLTHKRSSEWRPQITCIVILQTTRIAPFFFVSVCCFHLVLKNCFQQQHGVRLSTLLFQKVANMQYDIFDDDCEQSRQLIFPTDLNA